MREPTQPFVGATCGRPSHDRPPCGPPFSLDSDDGGRPQVAPTSANQRPKRKPNRLQNYDYSQNDAYFVTMCIKDKREILGHIVGAPAIDHPQFVGATCGRPSHDRPHMELSEIGKIVETEITQIPKIFDGIQIPCHVVMPNHVHMIIAIVGATCGRPQASQPQGAPTVSRLIKQWKGVVTKRIGTPIWQRSFHDHIIRNETDYGRIAEYIENNPTNWETDCFFMGTKS